jgi:hypothetical protein
MYPGTDPPIPIKSNLEGFGLGDNKVRVYFPLIHLVKLITGYNRIFSKD